MKLSAEEIKNLIYKEINSYVYKDKLSGLDKRDAAVLRELYSIVREIDKMESEHEKIDKAKAWDDYEEYGEYYR